MSPQLGSQILWWVHIALLLGFLVYIPVSKHLHLIACPVNEFLRNLKPRGLRSIRLIWRARR